MADDQEVVIVDASGTEHVFPPGFNPKHAAAIVRNGGSSALPTKPVSAEDFTPKGGGVLNTAKDVAIGAAKGLGSTVAGLGELAANAGAIPGVMPGTMLNPAFRHPAFQRAEEATTASNTAQRVGKVGEQVAEVAIPALKGARMIPNAARAGQKLQGVLQAAKDVPLDVNAAGDVALRIQQLAERGGTMPRMVRGFLQRATDPTKAPINFDEGRDFYSNISRLSKDEYGRLTGPVQREVGNLRAALNSTLQSAADTVGQGENYAKGIKEYAQAAKLSNYKDALIKALGKGLPVAGGAGAAYWLGNKVRGLIDD